MKKKKTTNSAFYAIGNSMCTNRNSQGCMGL